MKAVIMAGGEGSRLRPLTCDIPKPMTRLCGRPVLEYIFDLLEENGVEEAVLALGYLPAAVTTSYPDGKYGKLKLTFVPEEAPLGTAGSVKNAAEGFDEPFIVISGDAVCDFPLSELVDFHKKTGAAVSIALCAVDDPREYGLVCCSASGKVESFTEKPSWAGATTDLANTGIYVVSPECLALIPADKPFDFAKELFPLLMERDIPIFARPFNGYWCDVGDIPAYLGCQADILDGKVRCKMPPNSGKVFAKQTPEQSDFTVIPPVYLGENLELGKGCVIGPYAVIDDGCRVGAGAKIRSSVMFPHACAAAGSRMTGAVLCESASLGSGASMFEGSTAGSRATVGSGAQIKPNVLIWPEKNVESDATARSNVKHGSCSRTIFDDTGIGGDKGIDLTPEACAGIGAAIGSSAGCRKAGIASDGSAASKTVLLALEAGLMSAGCHVWSFGECFESQLSFFTAFCGLGIGIFVGTRETTQIKICGEAGLPIPVRLEREIERRVAKAEYIRSMPESRKDIADMSSIRMMYARELMRQAPYELHGLSAHTESPNERITLLLSDTLSRLGCADKSDLVLSISQTGTSLKVFESERPAVEHEKLLAVCCFDELRRGNDIVLPFDAPMILDSLAESFGRKAYRYPVSPLLGSDSQAHRLSSKQVFVRDGLFLAVRLLSVIKERSMTLTELVGELPDFFVAKKTFSIGFPPSRLTQLVNGEQLSASGTGEGILIKEERGRLLISPSKSGKALRVFAEAESMEAAQELCADIENRLIKKT